MKRKKDYKDRIYEEDEKLQVLAEICLQRLENGYQLLLLEYFYLDLYLWLYSNKLQF